MKLTVPLSWVIAAGAAVALAACSEPTTAPNRSSTLSFATSASPSVYSSSAATGRSGNAAITEFASLDGAGLTHLSVTSYALPNLSAPAGSIAKVQVKAFDLKGKLVLVDNNNRLSVGSVFTHTYSGLAAGFTIQVQANVVSIDGKRTDVVTASVGVVLGDFADLAVRGLGPVEATVNTPVTFSATVTELSGSPASATCTLLVDGAAAATVPVTAVAVGAPFTCTFAPVAIGSVGYHQVTVNVSSAVPADPVAANNTSTATVAVDDNPATAPKIQWSGVVSNNGFVSLDSSKLYFALYNGTVPISLVPGTSMPTPSWWTASMDSSPPISNFAAGYHERGRTQLSQFTGDLAQRIQFPIAHLVLTQATSTSPETILDSTVLTNLAANNLVSGGECSSGGNGAGLTYSICSYDAGYTRISYIRETTFDTLLNTGTNYLKAPAPCVTVADTTAYCYQIASNVAVGTLPAWGTSLRFNVSIQVANTVYGAAPNVPLPVFADSTSNSPMLSLDVLTNKQACLFPGVCFGTVYHEISFHQDYLIQSGKGGSLNGGGVTSVFGVQVP